MEVIVPDDQLSLAIGKRGQNVRLAHRLTGWKLDVRSEMEAEEEARSARARRSTQSPASAISNAELLYQWASVRPSNCRRPTRLRSTSRYQRRARDPDINAARDHVANKKIAAAEKRPRPRKKAARCCCDRGGGKLATLAADAAVATERRKARRPASETARRGIRAGCVQRRRRRKITG